jgi:hypothetical protein
MQAAMNVGMPSVGVRVRWFQRGPVAGRGSGRRLHDPADVIDHIHNTPLA